MSAVALVDVPPPGEWRRSARCVGEPTWVFFPLRGERAEDAKRVCAGCPVQGLCRAYGLAHPGLMGVFGGMTAQERRDERRLARMADREAS